MASAPGNGCYFSINLLSIFDFSPLTSCAEPKWPKNIPCLRQHYFWHCLSEWTLVESAVRDKLPVRPRLLGAKDWS